MFADSRRRCLATAIFACGFVFVGLAAYDAFFAAPALTPGVLLEGDADREIPDAVAGSTIELTFPLRNAGSRTARVIGFATC